MDDWPRMGLSRIDICDGAHVEVYRRDDQQGLGPSVSAYLGGIEVARYDLHPASPHYHLAGMPNQPRLYLPPMPLVDLADHVATYVVEHYKPACDLLKLSHDGVPWPALHAVAPRVRRALMFPPTRVLLPAAGDGSRWAEYTGVPKHATNIDGEALHVRTTRQLAAAMPQAATVLVDNDNARTDPERLDADKYLSSAHLWHPDGRTVVLFADVVFTDWAIEQVADPRPGFTLYGRPTPNPRWRKPWAEAFGMSFWPEHHQRIRDAAERCLDLRRREVTDGCSLWHLYRAMLGLPDDMMNRMLAGENLVLLDHATDDLDLPQDWHRWRQQR